jgi:hypothetical protein
MEECAQVGDPDYRANALRECRAYVEAVRNYLGREPDGARLEVVPFDGEPGTYYEAVCYFDPADPEAAGYARRCEAQAPATWAEGGVRPPEPVGPRTRGR